ncbi:MAG: NAD-dependent malic enzyme [Polyangiaceae bacterium]|nr:NAD-dependent malic enzyme [Polyangiaceae bacterium]
MMRYNFEGPANQLRAHTSLRGRDILRYPLLNKGTAFTQEERRRLGLEGLLPSSVKTIEQQVKRSYDAVMAKTSPLERYIGLAALQDRNETLFYRLLLEHTVELTPIVYTPTVGEACQSYSRIFRRSRGVWITPEHRGRIREVLAGATSREVRLLVVTDNERILGLGDQGAGGMGIPIGKLSLYTLGAGIHPSLTLPVSLDVGTDNQALLEDELYIGWRHPRLRGAEYHSLVDELVSAVKQLYPTALLQWEDFKKGTAFELLDRYRNELLCFNDDIQGTAAVALAGVMAACRAIGAPLSSQRVLILGAGAAGIGIATQLRDALSREGLAGDDLRRAIALVDSRGLLLSGRASSEKHKEQFAWTPALAEAAGVSPEARGDLAAVVEALKPTVLIGTSGQAGVFDEKVVRTMAKHVARPIVFPLSNPTSLSEARPEDVVRWTDGRALVATGSPFDPVTHAGREHRFAQANNIYVFPGVGLGALVARATVVTDSMFTVAAQELAARVSPAELATGSLFPSLTELRPITARIAAAVVREARSLGVARADLGDDAIEGEIERTMWYPAYPEIVAD